MTDYTELVKALRRCDMKQGCFNANCRYSVGKYFCDMNKVHNDAAAAIEALQAQFPKRGKWVEAETAWRCSICEAESPHTYPICPYCGSIVRTSLYDSEK